MSRYKSLLKHLDLLKNNLDLLPRIIKDYFRILIMKTKALRKVDIALTFECNANCQHCFSKSLRNASKKTMTFHEIKACIDQSIQLGAIAFEFTGGEPLLCPYLDESIQYAKQKKSIVAVTSNGLGITDRRIAQFEKIKLDVIQLSLDSLCLEEHDRSRGKKGCYHQVMSVIERLKRSDIKLMLSTIATNENMESNTIMHLIQYANDINVPISLNPASAVGGWNYDHSQILSEPNKIKFKKLLKNPNVRWAGHMNFLSDGCPCGTETIFVTAYGDVLPCGFIQITYGNIQSESLSRIWDRFQAYPLGDRSNRVCLAGLDTEFQKKYLNVMRHHDDFPLSIYEHPTVKQKDSRPDPLL